MLNISPKISIIQGCILFVRFVTAGSSIRQGLILGLFPLCIPGHTYAALSRSGKTVQCSYWITCAVLEKCLVKKILRL